MAEAMSSAQARAAAALSILARLLTRTVPVICHRRSAAQASASFFNPANRPSHQKPLYLTANITLRERRTSAMADCWATLSDLSPQVRRLRGLLNRFQRRSAVTDFSLWLDAREPYDRHQISAIFNDRSHRWWRQWTSSTECSLLKQCMAEIISNCPDAAKDARGEDREAVSEVFGAAMQLVKKACGPLSGEREACPHTEPWLMDWFWTPGRRADIAKAALAVASMPLARTVVGDRGHACSISQYHAVANVNNLIFLSATSPSERSASEVLPVKTLVELLGAVQR